MGRPAKKRKYAEAKATRKGELQAEYEFKKEHSVNKKPLDHLEQYFEGALSRIDPLEAIAVIGTTVLVKSGIEASTTLSKKVNALTFLPLFGSAAAFPFELAISWSSAMQQLDTAKIPPAEWKKWLISFAIAYILIKTNSLGLLEKSLSEVIAVFLP